MRRRRWPVLTALGVALVAAALAIGIAIGSSSRRPADNNAAEPTYTDQQVADAKAKVCATYDKVHQAVLVNTGRSGGDDPASALAMAANARMALFDGGEYLSNTLAEEPATPADLTKEIRALIRAYQHLALDYLAEAPDPEVQSSFDALDKPNAAVYGICK